MSDHTQAPELLPCPWCGEVPDISTDAAFRLTDGVKYGALGCCVTGPEVRTDYKDVPHWREAAIAAWNDRRSIPQGDDPAKAAAQGDELPPLPDFLKWWTSIETDERKWLIRNARADAENLHSLLRMAYEAGVEGMREYGASCRAGEKAEQKPDAWMVGLDVFEFLVDAERNVRNPEIQPIPLYRRVSAGEKADARDARLIGLLKEASATLKMWADVAPAVSLVKDIDTALSAQKGGEEGKGEGK